MDKRAQRILFNTYWSAAGWKPDGSRGVSPQDFAYAKKHGVMFDSLKSDHAEVTARLQEAIAQLSRRAVGDAFLASLSTRRLDWRSAFGSYAVFQHMPHHSARRPNRYTIGCAVCGFYKDSEPEDLNVLNFERLKWGGVRHDYATYAMLDLELLLKEPPPKPGPADIALFKALVKAIDSAPSGTTSANLQKLFPGNLKSNKAERDVIVGLLGYCGALGTSAHPGFSDGFVPAESRELPARRFVDMAYPACWWARSDGLNRKALEHYFGHACGKL